MGRNRISSRPHRRPSSPRLRRQRLLTESLEPRILLADAAKAATFDGAFTRAARPDSVTLSVEAGARGLQGRQSGGLLGLVVEDADASRSVDPAAIRIVPTSQATARTILSRKDVRDRAASLSIARVSTGTFSILASSERGTAGHYAIRTFLVGDVDGNGSVDQGDLQAIRQALGTRIAAATISPGPDVNLDGRITQADLRLARQNLGASFHASLANAQAFQVPGLSGATTLARFTLTAREASLRNEVGIFLVDDAQGRIGGLLPGDAQYLRNALSRNRRMTLFRPDQEAGAVAEAILPSGRFFGTYIMANGTVEAWLSQSSRRTGPQTIRPYLSFAAGNADRYSHVVRMQGDDLVVGFEDQWQGGDRDHNDAVLAISFSTAAPNVVGITLELDRAFDSPPIGDGITTQSRVDFVGRVIGDGREAMRGGLDVTLTGPGGVVLGTTRTDGQGHYRFRSIPLTLGPQVYRASIRDARGNEIAATTRLTYCGFSRDLGGQGWNTTESGGTDPGRGSVSVVGDNARLYEGTSFQVTLERPFVIPENPGSLAFEYTALAFDTTATGFIKDAFEVALLGDNDQPLVPTFAAGRDAFFNITEGMAIATGAGVIVDGSRVVVDLAGQIPGSSARLVFRLVNNDRDTTSSVEIVCAQVPGVPGNESPLDTPITFVQAPPLRLVSPTAWTSASGQPGGLASPSGEEGSGSPYGSVSVLANNPTGDTHLDSQGRAIFTTSDDFMRGTLFNLNLEEVPGELRLNPAGEIQTYPFIWIANSGEGTVSRFDTRTGAELGRYRTGANTQTNPSRLAVTPEGDVWVLNRADNTAIPGNVVKILGSGFIDRNGNGVMDTAIDLNGDGYITGVEVLPWDANGDGQPDDERIALVIHAGRSRTNPSNFIYNGGARGVVLDTFGKLWVGLNSHHQYEVFDAVTGEFEKIVPVDGAPYGAVIAPNGILYSTNSGSRYLDAIDTRTQAKLSRIDVTATMYGITVDRRGVLWLSPYPGNQLIRYDTNSGQVILYPSPNGATSGAGIAVDRNGNVWAGRYNASSMLKWTFAEDGKTLIKSEVVSVPNGNATKSTAIDADGYVWTVSLDRSRAFKIDPVTHEVVMIRNTGQGPYNYSDMTGDIRIGSTERTGIWTEMIDGGRDAVPWATVSIAQDLPLLTSSRLRVRASDSRSLLPGLTWKEVDPDSRFDGIQGRFLEVEVALRSRDPEATPSVQEVFIQSVPVPMLEVELPRAVAEGTTLVLSGLATAAQPVLPSGARARNAITHVTVNGKPVDQLDEAGRFFSRSTVLPGTNELLVEAYDIYGQVGTTRVQIEGTQRPAGEVDWSILADITASFTVEYARTSFFADDRTLFTDVAVKNVGQYPVDAPLYVAIANLSRPDILPRGAAGYTPDGLPFYDVSGLVSDGRLLPGALTGSLEFAFWNERRVPFTYDLVFYGLLNRAPLVTTIPVVEAHSGRVYRYNLDATDPDGDMVSYHLVNAPASMTIDRTTGLLTWSPAESDLGSHPITVCADDGRGGTTAQTFTLAVTVAPPNRPPVFTSLPVISSFVGTPYRYDADAADPDGDDLLYRLVGSIPAGMTINETTGEITWTPSQQQLGEVSVIVEATDTRGGSAQQPYAICVLAAPANKAPVIVSQPVTTVLLPTTVIGQQNHRFFSISGPPGQLVATRFDWTIRSAVFNNEFGVYKIDDEQGSVNGILPGQPGYGAMALTEENSLVVFRSGQGAGARSTVPLIAGQLYGAYIIQNGTTGQFRQGTRTAFFSFNEANNGVERVRTRILPNGQTEFAWEDHVDFDFTDVVYTITADLVLGSQTAYMYQIAALDPDNDSLGYRIVSGPPGMFIDSQSGMLAWTVGINLIGSHGVTVRVEDGRGGFDIQSFTLAVLAGGGEIRGTVRENGVRLHLAESTFDTDIEGWSVTSGRQELSWVSSEGNPDGFAMWREPGVASIESLRAPEKFLGDWRNIDNKGYLTYDHKIISAGGVLSYRPYRVDILGPGGTAFWEGDTPSGLTDWVSIEVPIQRDSWIVTSGTWDALIRNVTALDVRIEQVGNNHFRTERAGLDNVTLVSETGIIVPGTTVYLDMNQNGLRDPGELSTQTDNNGAYAFTGLAEGTYFVAQELNAGWVQTYPGTTPAGTNIIRNGDFEIGPDPVNSFFTLSSGSTVIEGWTVTGEQIDYKSRGYWVPASGNRSVDLNGFVSGAIAQDLETIPGVTYQVDFALVGNPSFPPGTGPQQRELQVSAADQVALFPIDATGNTFENMAWVPRQWTFVADSTRTTLEFRSLTPGAAGPAIDNVSVRPTSSIPGSHVVVLGAGQVVTGVDFGNRFIGDTGNNDPVFLGPPPTDQRVTSLSLFRRTIAARDPDGDTLAFDLPVAPGGMTVHPTLGVVVWTPTADQVGSHQVVLRVQDGRGGLAIQAFTIEVSAPSTAPVLSSTPPGPATVGLPYEYRLQAQDAEGDALTFRLVAPQASNLTLSPSGVLHFTPTAAQVGQVSVTVGIDAAQGPGSEATFTIPVVATSTNRDPIIRSTPRLVAWQGLPYAYQVVADDPDGDPLRYELVRGPAGMTINQGFAPDGSAIEVPGLVIWQPGAEASLAAHEVVLRVSDGRGPGVTQAFTVEVRPQGTNQPPRIVSNPLLVATVARPYVVDLRAEDPDGDPVTWTLVSAPRGMSLDPLRGTLRWTPSADQLGPHEVLVQATDPYLQTATQRFTVVVSCRNQAPQIISRPPTVAYNSEPYVYAVRADDPENDVLTFRFLSSVPTGMTIDARTGLIRWVPNVAATTTYTIALEVSDGQGNLATQVYTLEARAQARNRPPVITSLPRTSATAGADYAYAITAIDPEGEPLRFELLAGPDGMSIDATTGRLTWSPGEPALGEHVVTVAAIDPGDARGLQTFLLTVALNQPPTIDSTPVVTATAGATYRYDVRASDPNSDPIIYTLLTGPAGMTIDQVGRVRWQPAATFSSPAPIPVTIAVRDPLGLEARQSYAISVAPDTEAPRVEVAFSSNLFNPGDTGRFRITASDNVGVAALNLTLGGRPLTLDATGFATNVMATPGVYPLVGTATDAAGNVGRWGPVDIRVFDPGDQSPPVITIISPDRTRPDTTVTYLTEIVGSVQDDNLEFWSLDYARVDRVNLDRLVTSDGDNFAGWTNLARGTANVGPGVLGVFDPTVLMNGPYVIRLMGRDVNGLIRAEAALLNVAGDAKIGNFRLDFTDLQVPLAGIPITITRTYDTLQAGDEGDFGHGWSLSIFDPQLFESAAIGEGGAFTPGNDKLIPNLSKVYLTNPEGRRVGFTYREELISASFFGGIWRPYFTPDPGVYDTLTIDETIVFRGGISGALLQGINPDIYTLTTKDGTKYRYHQTSGLQRIDDLNGNRVTFSAAGIVHSSGASVTFERDHRGRIRSITQRDFQGNPVGTPVRYTYDAAGDLRTVTDQAGLVTSFRYLAAPNAHFLDEAYDSNGVRVLKVVYENNRFVRVIDALGNTVDQRDYDLERRTAIVRDANGNPTTLVYDDRGNVLRETDPLGHVIIREYADPRHPTLETKIIDKRGFITERTYDARGNVTQITETGTAASPFADPITTTFRYDTRNNITAITNDLGRATTFSYDGQGNLTRITNALGDSSSFTYDSQGRRKTFTDFNGHTTTFEYKSETCGCSSPSKVIFADGTYQRLEYNQYGQVTLEAYHEADGTLVEIARTRYDNLGREIETIRGQGADAIITRKVYKNDRLDYEIVVNPASPNETRNTPVAQRQSRITAYDYDAAGRIIRQINPDGGIVEFRYDAQGNRVLLMDPVGNVTTWVYDGMNRVAEERDPFYWRTYTENIPVGNINIEAIVAANRLPSGASITDRRGADHVRVFGYDAEGNQTAMIDRNGRLRTFAYDHAGRMTQERWFAGTSTNLLRTMVWQYDALGNLMEAYDPDSHYRYTYDRLNRVTSVDNNPLGTLDLPRVILSYRYDRQGNVVSTSDNFGVTVASEYDARNRLKVRTWFDAQVAPGATPDVDPVRIDFKYNAAGRQSVLERRASLDAAAPIVARTTTSYYTNGLTDLLRHANAVDEVLASYDYGYDFGGLVVTEDRDHQDPQYRQTIEYGYDLNGQLIRADFDTQPDESYVYDLNGNRIRSEDHLGVRLYRTGLANQLLSDGRHRFEYDGEGNMVKKIELRADGTEGAVTTYVYDHRNMMVRVDDWSRDPGDPANPSGGAILTQSVEFTYDVLGRRIAQSVDADGASAGAVEKEHFVLDGDHVWADFDATGVVAARYLLGNRIDQLLARQRDGEDVVFYLTDQLGSMRDLADKLGSLVNHIEYGSFGHMIVQAKPFEGDRYQFTGRELSATSGLYFNRARYYSPLEGRFVHSDPLGFTSTDLNLYRSANNSWLNYVDPFGTASVPSYILNLSQKVVTLLTPTAGMMVVLLPAFCILGPFTHITPDNIKLKLTEALLKAGGASDLEMRLVVSAIKISSGYSCIQLGIVFAWYTQFLTGLPSILFVSFLSAALVAFGGFELAEGIGHGATGK